MHPIPEPQTDARGKEIPAGPYSRVVSLVPSLTETMFGLGANARCTHGIGDGVQCQYGCQRLVDIALELAQ